MSTAGLLSGIADVRRDPVRMLRNPTGVSNAPGEHAEDDDVEAGVRALADVLWELARWPR